MMLEENEIFCDYPDILTAEETVCALRIGYNSLYVLLNTKKIHAYRQGRVWRIPKEALLQYVRAQSGL